MDCKWRIQLQIYKLDCTDALLLNSIDVISINLRYFGNLTAEDYEIFVDKIWNIAKSIFISITSWLFHDAPMIRRLLLVYN